MATTPDLAALYGVPTKRLNEQVKRNSSRFPPDFAFRLTPEEAEELNRSQNATGSQKHRDPRFSPYAFTEHGAIMAANVLNSRRAVEASVYVVRAFVRLRHELTLRKELAHKLGELEQRIDTHDAAIRGLMAAIRQLADDGFRARVGAAAAVEGARHDEPRNFAQVHEVIRTAVARNAGPLTAE